jgi:predicted transcriptional regulator
VEISSKALIYLRENRKALYLLALIGNSWTKVKDLLSSNIGIASLGALHYYVDRLASLGLIECDRVGRYRYCKRTELGERLLAVFSSQRKVNSAEHKYFRI